MLTRGARRTLSFGLQTVLGLRKRGFFIPLRTAEAASTWADRPSEALAARFRAAEPAFRNHLAEIEALAGDWQKLDGPPPEPRFDQSWFPRLDAAALYTAVRRFAPQRIVEVGSGHSTRFIVRAVRDGGLDTTVTAIDPQPRADIEGLPLDLRRATLQKTGLAPFAGLAAGDLVFVDSSHVLMPGTDVDIILNHVLPALPEGVLIGFHDIFLPAPYPSAWPFNVYNEQNAVGVLAARSQIVFASAYVVAEMAEEMARTAIGRVPLMEGARESLLLMRL